MSPRARAEAAGSLTSAQTAVLGLLAERPRSGYELNAVVRERGMREWTDLATSSVYAILQRLVAAQLIVASTEVVNNRARTRHALTPEGRRKLAESVAHLLADVGRPLSGFDVGVANLPSLPPRRAWKLLVERQHALEREIERLEAAKRERALTAPYFVRALFDRPLAQLRGEHEWLNVFISEVDTHAQARS